jgi:hypothetical protein
MGKDACLGAGFARALFKRTGKPVLYADCENGETSIPGWVEKDLWQPGDGDIIDESYDILKCADSAAYSGLVISTISSLGDLILQSVTKKNYKSDPTKEVSRMNFRTRGGNTLMGPSQTDYLMAQSWFKEWFAAHATLLRAGKFVLWLSHQKIIEIEHPNGTTEVMGGPLIIGSALTREAPKIMQELFRIEARLMKAGEQPRRILQVENSGVWQAKDRYRAFPPTGVEIGVVREATDTADSFERKIVAKGEAVWDTMFKAMDRIRGGNGAPAISGTTVTTGGK